jgi:hypothetical protein
MIAFRLPCTLGVRLLVGFVIAAVPCLSGPLYLKSNVNFDLQPQALLQASSDHTEFGEPANANGDDDISVKTDGVVDPDAIPDPTADASHILITGCTILHGHSNILLDDVQISAQTGVVVENASLTVNQVQITVQQGPSYILEQEASVNPVHLKR